VAKNPKNKIQIPNKFQDPNTKLLNDLGLNDSFGFWALGFGIKQGG